LGGDGDELGGGDNDSVASVARQLWLELHNLADRVDLNRAANRFSSWRRQKQKAKLRRKRKDN
jgi:hypothetical protein